MGSSSGFPGLNDEQVKHFLRRGHVVVPACFSRETAREWTERFWARTGYAPGDPTTWKEKRMHLPSSRHVEIKDFAPKAWDAIRGLLGGVERIAGPCHWGDAFSANLGVGADRPWEPPSARYVPIHGRWHKDGDFFRHFLDSPEQALLTIVLWTDIQPRGGGNFLACDSVAPVARLLQAHPEAGNEDSQYQRRLDAVHLALAYM